MKLQSLTPVLFVERIEPCLPFWTERLGFHVEAEVREGMELARERERVGDAASLEGMPLGFVMLVRDGVPVMLQSRESVRKDVPAVADMPSSIALYLKVDDLAAFEPRLAGLEVVAPKRRTFYGATEITVRDPAGNLVCVSQHDEG